jgi:hypothetical protein
MKASVWISSVVLPLHFSNALDLVHFNCIHAWNPYHLRQIYAFSKLKLKYMQSKNLLSLCICVNTRREGSRAYSLESLTEGHNWFLNQVVEIPRRSIIVCFLSLLGRGLQRDVVYLDWPIAPSYMSPNAGGGGGGGVAGPKPMSTAVHLEPK